MSDHSYTRESILSLDDKWISRFVTYLNIPYIGDVRLRIFNELNKQHLIIHEDIVPVLGFDQLLCVPITEMLVGVTRYDWKLLVKLAIQGVNSKAWQVCLDGNNCQYVLKHVTFKNSDGTDTTSLDFYLKERSTKSLFLQEISIQTTCVEHGLCPTIVEAWLCEHGGTVVMEKLDKTVFDLLTDYKSHEVRSLILVSVLGILVKLHALGIAHGDTHLDNFMVKINRMTSKEITAEFGESTLPLTELERYQSKRYKYYLLDMGRAILTDDYNLYIHDFTLLSNRIAESKVLTPLVRLVDSFTSTAK